MPSNGTTTIEEKSWLDSRLMLPPIVHETIEKKHSDISKFARVWNGRTLGALRGVCSLKLFREPTLPLKVALGIALLVPIVYSWHSLRLINTMSRTAASTTSASTLLVDTNSNSNSNAGSNTTQGHTTDGLRMVVFGGGDIATSALSASEWSNKAYAWPEIMCRKLGCDTYVSFVPLTDGGGGPVVSNDFLDAAYKRVSRATVHKNKDDGVVKLDYSWATEQYPKPHQSDLATQINSFLSSPLLQRNTVESLWVFNVGYWDIWYLAALPRKLATEVIDSSIQDLFFQIERLYRAMRDQELAASPEPHPGIRTGRATRPPFRIFLTRLFDISLTPGFASARPIPPRPHSSSSQLRSAAFLTRYWNYVLDLAVNDWLTTSDPEYWSTTDKIDIKVVEALAGKHSLTSVGDLTREKEKHDHLGWRNKGELDDAISLPRRRLASYGMPGYLRGLMVDRQLRNAELSDHNGLGARPPEDGFLDISMPCVIKVAGERITDEGDIVYGEGKRVVCQDPDNYLFYTEFTVSPRAIYEIGVHAARSFLDQVEDSSAWKEKAMRHTESDKEDNGQE
ncbi:hypothetical protein F5B22DRAFT_613554 [Xylaria bambusicola]|uniref:uncharacterized protein n=1 Tax=Xylaria bambusicola TaxID=326684 RepID=UPI002008C2A6|nr:uncharacterized protein F5B22DRAFT_613554 [Xylaria bambusicola]KAI0512877.1 hypothetical protein F5B22DRAFT_613554 [Xylaria bambusicola]